MKNQVEKVTSQACTELWYKCILRISIYSKGRFSGVEGPHSHSWKKREDHAVNLSQHSVNPLNVHRSVSLGQLIDATAMSHGNNMQRLFPLEREIFFNRWFEARNESNQRSPYFKTVCS